MKSLYEVLLQEGHIKKLKSEGYNVEIKDYESIFRDQCYKNVYQENCNIRQDSHRMEESDYDRDFDYFNYIKPQMDHENRYYHKNAKNQGKMYELDAPKKYEQPCNRQRKRGNQRQRQRVRKRVHGHNEFYNQNRNTNFEEHCQNRDMTSEGYEREIFYNRDQNWQEYNVESRNLQHRFIDEEESIYLRDECRRHNNIQDDYGREEHRDYGCFNYNDSYMNYEEPYFVNDNFETNYFIETRPKNKKIYNHDFTIPPIIFKDSPRNQSPLKDKKQLDHNVSLSIKEPHLQTENEESSDMKVIHNPEETSENEQTALYVSRITDTTEENISINEKLPDNKIVDRIRNCIKKVDLLKAENQNYFLDNKIVEGSKKNKKDTSQNTDSKSSKLTIEVGKENQLKTYTCPNNETLLLKNDISESKVIHGLNEIKPDQKRNEKVIKKKKELLDNKETNYENITGINNSYPIIKHVNSDSPIIKLRKGKPPGKIKSLGEEQFDVKSGEGRKEEEFSGQMVNENVIILADTYAEEEEFPINKTFSSHKSVNQESLEMIERNSKLSVKHQKHFLNKFLLESNEKNKIKNEEIYKLERKTDTINIEKKKKTMTLNTLTQQNFRTTRLLPFTQKNILVNLNSEIYDKGMNLSRNLKHKLNVHYFQENKILRSKTPKILETKLSFNRLGIG